jgi:hypothetical protein
MVKREKILQKRFSKPLMLNQGRDIEADENFVIICGNNQSEK